MNEPKSPKPDRLNRYREKRSTDATPEPFGSSRAQKPRVFAVHKHDATRLHYDLRMEWGGTLLCWAIPRGLSMNPDNKRLAVATEDHPVEYAEFEGVIPKGNYGAGPMILWDKGYWVPIDDPDRAEEAGKLHFALHGYKLRGEFYMVKTSKGGPKEWLLAKKKDEFAVTTEEEPYTEELILSGLTVEELGQGQTRSDDIQDALEKASAPERPVDPFKTSLMLAKTEDTPFSSPEWIFELKYDGYRVLAHRSSEGKPALRSRNGHDITASFPDVARAVKALPYPDLVLDGELVVLDPEGRSDFNRLQKRARLRRRHDVEKATVELPATLFAFDFLGFEGFDLRPLPLLERKRLLQLLLPSTGPIRYSDHIPEHGEAMFSKVTEMRLEGIMAKKADAPYQGGRSSRWLKLKADRTGDFVVCGYTPPKGGRPGFGALLVSAYDGDRLVFAGRVGGGFSDAQLTEYHAALEDMREDEPACEGSLPRDGLWVRPEWVAEVRYKTWTSDHLLRHPIFLRLRDDKSPEECRMEDEARPSDRVGGPSRDDPAPSEVQEEHDLDKKIKFSNLNKVFWPEDGYTKGDLIEYYRAVAPWALPYLKDRPLVLTRYPDGIHESSFYQKNVPDFTPDWIRTEPIWTKDTEKEIEYYVCDDVDTLLYIANSAGIPLHIWSSRVGSIPQPDWCLIDLDPKDAPFAHVVTLAKAVRSLCDEIGLETFVKTTGSTGLHVLIPLGRQCTYEQSRMLGQLISKVIESRHPDLATMKRVISQRKARVYLDFLQNRTGQLLVAPYSVRPLPGAPVSAPLEWREVNGKLDPQKYTIKNLLPRLKRKKQDPMLAVLEAKPDLLSALERLSQIVAD